MSAVKATWVCIHRPPCYQNGGQLFAAEIAVTTTPLHASSVSAGTLISNYTFEVPPYQREYSWTADELEEFWSDLCAAQAESSYFLGLVILTGEGNRKQVVDGQQRLLTLTLLAAALHVEALKRKRTALADRIEADFLKSIDYDTDETHSRVVLSDEFDNLTLQKILNPQTQEKQISEDDEALEDEEVLDDELNTEALSARMRAAYKFLSSRLQADLKKDAFKRLGQWADFITNRLYFAVFIHPDSASAYRVFEVINTRGRDLTTADLLKNYLLSQTTQASKKKVYEDWKRISRQFPSSGSNSFVQYIRHAVTVDAGHILPKDLFDFVAERVTHTAKPAPTPTAFMNLLKEHLPLYTQMVDPSNDGPADSDELGIFAALNSLQVIAVRPILLAVAQTDDALEGMKYVLRLVVRRIVVGNLGTGNIERRFGEAARKVHKLRSWQVLEEDLGDLNPPSHEFAGQLQRRSYNKGVLAFLRRSIISKSMTPPSDGTLHFILPRQLPTSWSGVSEEDANFWGSTIGNTFLSEAERRPKGANSWAGFKENVLHTGIPGEIGDRLRKISNWDAEAIANVGRRLAQEAADVWY